jgi:MoaA/NifB/PqqE/SkfB family radical SAM enzyme
MAEERQTAMDQPASEAHDGAAAPRDTFCVLAFNHLQLAPNGTAKMCCIAGEDITGRNGPLTLYRDTYEQLWNSPYMRSARRGMAEGEKISACTRCYHEEDAVGVSRRTLQNDFWLGRNAPSREDILADAAASNWAVQARPTFLQLNLGNLCNLGCRMCSSQYSSRIAADPVHSKWMPESFIDAGRWRGDRLSLGPRPTFGVRLKGFYEYECYADQALRWTNGAASIDFMAEEGTRLTRLIMRLSPIQAGQALAIGVNGETLHTGRMQAGQQDYEFDLTRFGNYSDFYISLNSDQAMLSGDTRRLGVAVWDIAIERQPDKRGNAHAFTRFDRKGGWWTQKDLLLGEILAEPAKVRRLIFQGGEPLLIPEVQDILSYLVENGAASSVEIELTSNMTILPDRFLETLRHFRAVDGGCSIDGIGSDFEYIRYPASWREVEENVRRLGTLPNVNMVFNVAVQAYNLMNIADLFGYCDAHAIRVEAHFLVGPQYLSVLILPRKARRIAAERLRAYIEAPATGQTASHNRDVARFMIHFLVQHDSTIEAQHMAAFMEFTNDMDVSRGQSFAESHAELVDLLAEDGFPWVVNTRYAHHMKNAHR